MPGETKSSKESSLSSDDCPTTSGVQLSSLSRDGRRSAFTPYRVNDLCKPSTVLTNLQRGNVQTQTPSVLPERSIHQLAAQGELFSHHLDEGVTMDEVDENGYTPLIWASAYGQLATVKLLLERGSNPEIKGLHGESSLLLASANGHVHVVKELISHGVNVNDIDEDGNSALLYAASQNHALCVHELLKASADITIQNMNMDTAFSVAIAKGSKQVQLILERHIVHQLLG